MSALADRLREAMALASVSQADLARACGVKAPSVNGWLSGKSKFLRGENLLKAASRLGVSPKWLAEGRGPMRLAAGEQPPADEPAARPVELAHALPVFLEAVAQAPQASRAELAQVLGLLVTTGSALYAQRVTELLTAAQVAPSKGHSVQPPPQLTADEMRQAQALTRAIKAADAFAIAPAPHAVEKP
jgi:transcriptional regulator with XRE-family HTH domain